MRTLIISDIHNRVDWIDSFLKDQTYDELVFLGDYFDSWGDTIEDAKKTANWLKWTLDNYKNTTWLLGNHDIPYVFPWNMNLSCPGWAPLKSHEVNNILTTEDWNKFKLSHYTQGFLLSHAGVYEQIFSHPISGITAETIEARCQEALENAKAGLPVVILSAGLDRKGSNLLLPGGGITWLHWDTFEPVEGLNQIVGHTIDSFVRSNCIPGSENYCLDTHNMDIGVILDGKFSSINNHILTETSLKRVNKLPVGMKPTIDLQAFATGYPSK